MGNPQGTGGPIEEAAKTAVHHDGDATTANPVEHYANEARAAVGANPQAGMMSAGQMLSQAQRRFIAAQTAFIHDKDPVSMRTAQVEYIIELLDFVGAQDTGTALTMGERYITDLHQLIEQRNMS